MKNYINYITILIVVFIIIMVSILILNFYDITFIQEIIIPEVKINDGGIQKKYNNFSKPVIYLNKLKKRNHSLIKLNRKIKYNQTIKRFFKVSGTIKPDNSKNKNLFQSVIFEIRTNNQYEFVFLPVSRLNKFEGYLYFKNEGEHEIYVYLFYDYLSFSGRKVSSMSSNFTTASVFFKVNVLEAVPEKYHYLLPTKGIDCGNKKLRKKSDFITKDCKSNREKAEKIYEYLVFGDKKNKYRFNKNYKKDSIQKYHNAYIASQVINNKEGICNDFSEVYAALLRAQGIKVKKIWGYYDKRKTVGHMWNLVDVTGDEKEWLQVDAAWGNIDKKNYKRWAEFYPVFNEEYFMKSFRPYTHESFKYYLKIEY